jgi:hypothetical protein
LILENEPSEKMIEAKAGDLNSYRLETEPAIKNAQVSIRSPPVRLVPLGFSGLFGKRLSSVIPLFIQDQEPVMNGAPHRPKVVIHGCR